MIQPVSFRGSENAQVQQKSNENIIDGAKVKASQYKDAFLKSDGDTKAKINTAFAMASGLGALVGLFGHKNGVARWLGAAVSVASSVCLAVLNFPQKLMQNKADNAQPVQVQDAEVNMQTQEQAPEKEQVQAPQNVPVEQEAQEDEKQVEINK